MKSLINSVIVAFFIGLFLLGAFMFTGLGVFVLILITLAILVGVFLIKVIKGVVKIGIVVGIVVIGLLLFNNSFSQSAKLTCSQDNQCITGGFDVLANKCSNVVNKNYYNFFVNKKDTCGGDLGLAKCVDKKCSYISKNYCNTDADCVCGGLDVNGECFLGNKDYYNNYVDKTKNCPDFCNGIANNLEVKCQNNVCVQKSTK